MAKHIQHRYTKNTEHVFNKDELLLGEIGVNIGSGTLSILNENKKKVHEFINKEDINELVDNVTLEINNTLSDIDQRVATIEEGNLKVDLSDYATNESVDEKIGELDQKLNEGPLPFYPLLRIGVPHSTCSVRSQELEWTCFITIIFSLTHCIDIIY